MAVLGEELAADVLQQEFTRRVAQQPVRFNLSFTLAQPQDDAADPTVLWPAERQQLIAGQLLIREVLTTDNSSCDAINFDPLILPLGMQASADPILRARSAAYAESYRRRAREQLLNTTVGARP